MSLIGIAERNHALYRFVALAGAFESASLGLMLFLGPQIGIDLVLSQDAADALSSALNTATRTQRAAAVKNGGYDPKVGDAFFGPRDALQLMVEVVGVILVLLAFVLYAFAQGSTVGTTHHKGVAGAAQANAASGQSGEALRPVLYFHPNALWLKGLGEAVSGILLGYLSATYAVAVSPFVPILALQQLLVAVIDLIGGSGERRRDDDVLRAGAAAAAAAGASSGDDSGAAGADADGTGDGRVRHATVTRRKVR